MKSLLLAPLVLAALSVAATPAFSREWPSTPVKVVVPFDAGSTPDLAARLIGERLATRLHQPFVVENKSGASGNIGTDMVAKAAGDGRTVGVSIAGPLGVNALLFRKMPYDVASDIALVSIAVSQPSVLVVGSNSPISTAKQLAAMLKQKTPISYASIGAGSISHLAMAALVAQAGGDAVHAPYRGSATAVTALLSGEVNMALLPAAAVMPHVKAGKLRALAVASPARSASLPELPTLTETGLPEVKGDAWIGFIAPAKTPVAIINSLHEQLTQVLAEPELKEKLRLQYMDPVGNTPAEFRALLAADVARWKPVVEKNKINLD